MIQLNLDTSGIDRFVKDLELAMAALDREISARFTGWTFTMFKDLVANTPQWSGDLAANWKYTLNGPSGEYTPIPNKEGDAVLPFAHGLQNRLPDVYQRGAEPAVGAALAQLANVKPTWRDVVYFTNNTPIADKVSQHVIKIRPVNLIEGNSVFMLDMLVAKAEGGAYVP